MALVIDGEYDRSAQDQIDDAHRAIGRYIVEFSRLIFHMRFAMIRQFSSQGVEGGLVELLIGEATADPITNTFFKMCETVAVLDEDEQKIAAWLRNRVRTQSTERNNIAHGDWWIGLAGESGTELAHPRLVRTKPSRSKPHSDSEWSPAALDERSDALVELRQLVAEFGYLALDVSPLDAHNPPPEDLRVRDVFIMEKGEVVREGPRADEVDQGFYP